MITEFLRVVSTLHGDPDVVAGKITGLFDGLVRSGNAYITQLVQSM
jgi:hypothetical protein